MREREQYRFRSMARGLGWGSLGLGALQLSAPDAVRRLAGVDDSPVARVVVPLAGVRQFFHMAVLLGSRQPERWVWTRVAGDAVDLAALGCAVSRRRGPRQADRRRRAMTAMAAVGAITAVDVYTAVRGGRQPFARGLDLHASITVKRPREEVYGFWRDLENLPRFMIHLRDVRLIDQRRSYWVAEVPARRPAEWYAEIIEDRPGELIAWRSSEGAAVPNSGVVRFGTAPGDRGTEVHVEMRYEPPAGAMGAAFARLLGEHPEQQVRDDLRRFKQVLETGEVVRSEGSPQGARATGLLRQRPARPVTSGGIP
jgi:uncharacterized membrane protein